MESLDINVGSYGLMSGNGIDLCAYQQIAELARLGHRVSVYTFQKNLPDIEGVTLHKVNEYRRFWTTKNLLTDPRYREGDFFLSFGSPFFMLAPRLDNHVMVEYGTPAMSLASSAKEALFFSVIRRMTVMAARNSLLVLPGSMYLYDSIRQYADNCYPIHSGIDFSKSYKTTEYEQKLTPTPYILYIGRHAGYKNVHLLAKMMRGIRERVPDATLITVGRIDANYAKRMAMVINTPGVRYLGYVDDIWPLYRNATVYANASLWEGEDRPALEAQATGTPVVTFNNCSHPEVVHYGRCVSTAIDFQDALIDYLEYPEKDYQVGHFIRNEYGVAHAVESWLKRLKRLL